MSWGALGMVGLGAVSTSPVLWQGRSRQAVGPRGVLFGTLGMDASHGCRSRRKAGSSRGPGRAAGSQQAVLLLPTAPGSHSGEAGAGHCTPAAPQRSARPAQPEPVPAALGAGPSCARSWKKHLCEADGSCPSRMKAAGHWPCPVLGLCCATEEGCAGWGDLLSPPPPTAAFGLLSPLVQAATQGKWQRNRAVRTLPSLQGH